MNAQEKFDEANRRLNALQARYAASGMREEDYFRAHPEERSEQKSITRLRDEAHTEFVLGEDHA